MLPHLGYRVRTLHGLAHDIVRERPDLVGLADRLPDRRRARGERHPRGCRPGLAAQPPGRPGGIPEPDLEEDRLAWVLREKLPELVDETALAVIRYAKDQQLAPERLRQRLDEMPCRCPWQRWAAEIYTDYQRALLYRGAVDFDDLIRLALEALSCDASLLERLRHRWPFILEDEAQDSSRLQEEILHNLPAATATGCALAIPTRPSTRPSPPPTRSYLRDFWLAPMCRRGSCPTPGAPRRASSTSPTTWWIGRLASTQILSSRCAGAPPVHRARSARRSAAQSARRPSEYLPLERKFTPQEEIEAVANSLARWLPEHTDGRWPCWRRATSAVSSWSMSCAGADPIWWIACCAPPVHP